MIRWLLNLFRRRSVAASQTLKACRPLTAYERLPVMTHFETLCAQAYREGGYDPESNQARLVAAGIESGLHCLWACSGNRRHEREKKRELRQLVTPAIASEAGRCEFGILGSLFLSLIINAIAKFVADWLFRKWHSGDRKQLAAAQREVGAL